MKNRTLLILLVVGLLVAVFVVRARGGGFLRSLAPMIHGSASFLSATVHAQTKPDAGIAGKWTLETADSPHGSI